MGEFHEHAFYRLVYLCHRVFMKSTVQSTTTGLKVNAGGMTCCLFHQDKHPSMKVDERYYCFGCHQTGDVIDFVSQMFALTLYQAARKLAKDFGLRPSPSNAAALPVPIRQSAETARKREGRCVSVLTASERLLKIKSISSRH